jgi:hypothetical protein
MLQVQAVMYPLLGYATNLSNPEAEVLIEEALKCWGVALAVEPAVAFGNALFSQHCNLLFCVMQVQAVMYPLLRYATNLSNPEAEVLIEEALKCWGVALAVGLVVVLQQMRRCLTLLCIALLCENLYFTTGASGHVPLLLYSTNILIPEAEVLIEEAIRAGAWH